MSTATKTRTVEVRIGALKAALLFAPKHDVRAYLCGACIDHGPKGVRLVATDGHRLLVVNLTDTPQNLSVRYVLSRDVMERAVKAYAKASAIDVTWSQTEAPDPEREGVTIQHCAKVTVGELAAEDIQDRCGKFPDYERIIPMKPSGEVAQFNALYLADCAKAADLLGRTGIKGYVTVAHNGKSAALVDLGEHAFAVLMPCRGAPMTCPPDWYTAAPAKAAAAA